MKVGRTIRVAAAGTDRKAGKPVEGTIQEQRPMGNLNQVEQHQSVVYESGHLEACAGVLSVVIPIRARENGRPECSGCGGHGPTDDQLPERRFEHVPVGGLLVFCADRMRRVNCASCGVTVERVPWSACRGATASIR